MEMTDKIEAYIHKILKNNECHIGMSALLSATTNCLFAQCNTIDEVIFFRNMFMEILDRSIKAIQVKQPPKK